MAERRVAIVTAASRGIGAACARELTARGYAVALLARSAGVVALARELGGLGRLGSVAEPADLAGLVRDTLDAYGRLDAVVDNTGHAATGPPPALGDDWHAALDLPVLNVVRVARLVTPAMARQGGGALVNRATCAAVAPDLACPLSATPRAGLAAFAKLYAREYARAGIRMNTVLPGDVDSYPVGEAARGAIPPGRPATVGEVAGAVAFLLSEDAAAITGQSLRVDGGLTRAL